MHRMQFRRISPGATHHESGGAASSERHRRARRLQCAPVSAWIDQLIHAVFQLRFSRPLFVQLIR